MNERFKFRLFDNEDKEIINSEGICVGHGIRGLYILNGDDRCEDDCALSWIYEKIITDNISENRFIIQQFTGLKDIKGKEVFEGDIIKIFFIDRFSYDLSVYGKYYAIAKIVFYNSAFRFRIIVDTSDKDEYRLNCVNEIEYQFLNGLFSKKIAENCKIIN